MIEQRILLALAGLLTACAVLPVLTLAQESSGQRLTFHVKYIAQDAVYLDGGRSAGLQEGQQLIVERAPAPPAAGPDAPAPSPSGIIASLKVVAVAASSAVCEISNATEPVQVGDLARLPPQEVQAERAQQQEQQRITGGRAYPQVISFTSGDPVVEEARASVPRPPSEQINRMRGRIGMEYSTLFTHATSSAASSDVGMVARFDMTRIGGTYWNFSGYWQGRFRSLSGGSQAVTVSDLINRTYHLALTYDNPNSSWVAGGGRLYLPWASSLDTIDGGYVGRRTRNNTIVGIFGGSTPDPTSYDYNPNQHIAGGFANFSGGDFDGARYTATAGVAFSSINWQPSRQFVFTETGIFFKRNLALYHAMEIDAPHTAIIQPATSTTPAVAASTGGLNRSYLTLRYDPNPHLELSLNDVYFRDLPTFDPNLIGTGLLDRYLFQGLSGGVRVNLPRKIAVYTNIGQSSRTGDAKSSWNQLYGITLGDIRKIGLRVDLRYSKFSSSFGSGDYKAVSMSRQISQSLDWQLIGGLQNFNSPMTKTAQTHFINTYLDWSPGKILFFNAGYTWQRGGTMNYDQFQVIVGKRF